MKRISIIFGLGILAIGLGALAQTDLDAFPVGKTTMVYQVTTEDMAAPQILELAVTVHDDGQYTVSLYTEATGTEDELASFGFIFGAASVSSGAGHDVSYSSLQALMDQRDRLQEGQEYLLPSGVKFTEIVGVTIAGVWCLQGNMVDEDERNTQMTVAFALSHPVYISPRIRVQELQDGEWVDTFLLELVEYHTDSEGG